MRTAAWIALLLTGCVGTVSDPGPGPTPPAMEQPDAGIVTPPTPDAPPPPTALELMQKWSGCMTIDDFKAANMASAWGTLLTSNGKQCQNCHGGGEYGFIATTDETLFFNTISKHSGYLAKYFAADVAASKVNVSMGSFQAANATLGHPPFNPTDNQGITALNLFYTATAGRTTCDPPKLVD